MEHINTTQPTPVADFPQSQDSVLSVSSTFSAPALPKSASNLSTSTAPDHDADSPSCQAEGVSPRGVAASLKPSISPKSFKSPQSPKSPISPKRPISPKSHISPKDNTVSPTNNTISPTSRASPTSPASHAAKRKAEGSFNDNDTSSGPSSAHKRNKSMDTHSSSRIGELSAQLKTRLSYAMVKVQNGWEKQSLDELEEVHSQRGSPNSAPGGPRLVFESPSAADRRRRPSGVSEMSDQIMMSPASDILQSHSTPSSYWRPGTRPAISAAVNLISVTGSHAGADGGNFDVGRRRRSSTLHAPPPLLGSGQKKHHSDLGVGPRVPATPRAGILRMPSQQAEKDAVDTLLFMSSPNNSQRFPHAHSAPTPLRAEPSQRRVMFDTYPAQERHVPMPAPSHYQYGPYAAHPAR